MEDKKILYTRLQVPRLTINTLPEEVQNTKSVYGEMLICRDNSSKNWGIKIGNGTSTIKDLDYLYKDELEQLAELTDKCNFSGRENPFYIDEPGKITIFNTITMNDEVYKICITDKDVTEMQENTIYIILEGEG